MRKTNISYVFGIGALSVLPALADTVKVSDAFEVLMQAPIDRLTSETVAQTGEYPASVGQPVFWLDCLSTNGWKFVDGTVSVTNIPSKPGSAYHGSRYLATTSDGGNFDGWGSTKMNAPVLTPGPACLNGPYLNFGSARDHRALTFSPDPDTATTEYPNGYNVLANIRTVIAVWGSDVNNGGHFLGGGGKTLSYGWHRAGDFVKGTGEWSGVYRWSSALVNENAQEPVRTGIFWHDGIPSVPTLMSYNGGWEVISFRAKGANAEAAGIGVNDMRSGQSDVSSGQQVAELLIYDRDLTDDERALVEVYLEKKWFSRNRYGFDGEARLGVYNSNTSGFKGTVEVESGETLEIDRVTGGTLSGSTLTKTGPGSLSFAGEGAENYTGEIVLKEGGLTFPALRPAPTAEQLPAHLYARFDPSDTSGSLATADGAVAGRRYVRSLANLVTSDDAYFKEKRFCLRAYDESNAPWLVENALGEGLHVIDAGCLTGSGLNGAHLAFATDEPSGGVISIHNVGTVVAVVGAQFGGGNLFNDSNFKRRENDTWDFRNPVQHHMVSSACGIYANDGRFWSNGMPWDASKGYETSGFQVVAYQTAGAIFSRLMMDESNTYVGGGTVGEILIWNRQLSPREVRDAQAYLAAKWLKRATPGYARPEGAPAKCEIQALSVPGTATIDVGTGRTVRIGKLAVTGQLIKTGDGILEVEQADFVADGKVCVRGGSVKGVGVRDVAADSMPAEGATVHLDASNAASLFTRVRDEDGATVLRHWGSVHGGIGLRAPLDDNSRSPKVVEDGLNGLNTVDFGLFGDASAIGASHGGTWMYLDRPLHSMRAIYAVIKYHGGDKKLGFLFGNYKYGQVGDTDSIAFHPGQAWIGDGWQWDGRFMYGYDEQVAAYSQGLILTNGVNAGNMYFTVATNQFMLLELHSTCGVPAGQVGIDRYNTDRSGGFEIGELVAYEHELSPRERVATRNYLMGKWFNRPPEALPPAPPAPSIVERDAVVDGELRKEIVEDRELTTLSGYGTFIKTGPGTLSFCDISDFSGKVAVESGTLVLKGADATVAPKLATEGIVYHADATKGLTTVTNDSGKVCVRAWASQTDNGYTAVSDGGVEGDQSVVYDPDLGYRPTVDINGYNAAMVWKAPGGDGIRTLSGIQSVFWLIGSQHGGGFMLGGGTNGAGQLTYAWHRGTYYPVPGQDYPNYVGNTNLCAIMSDHMQAPIWNADWKKNGEPVDRYRTHLSGKWDIVSMVCQEGESANASGFAYDGRSRRETDPGALDYSGYQRLAEVIVYDRRVTDEERLGIESYLACKWNFGRHEAATNVALDVSSGATVALEGAQRFSSAFGGGVIAGDLSLTELLVDAEATDRPTVDGTFTILPNQKVRFVALPEDPSGSEIKILSATAFEGLENLPTAEFEGDAPVDVRPRLRVRGNDLVVRFASRGLVITVR